MSKHYKEMMYFNISIYFKEDCLGTLFDEFANKIQEDSHSLKFTLDGKNLLRTDTLSSININVASIIDAQTNAGRQLFQIQIKNKI